MSGTGLRFTVLGQVRAWRGEDELPLGPPQRRAVLAILLLRRGNAVTAAELVDGLWGENAPPRAIGTLRTHVADLRRLLEPDRPRRAPARILVSVADGYALHVPAEALDLAVVTDLLAEAGALRAAGEQAKARDRFADALRRWPGEALSGLPGPVLAAQRAQLAERRLDALEDLIELRLELDEQPPPVPDLMALSTEHPLRERPRALLMTALARSGRHADALEVYADLQHTLAERLGLDPGPELVELSRRIRVGARPLVGAETSVVPAQLPADPVDFTGRSAMAGQLTDRMRTAPVTVVFGMPGVGKSALAVHVAHRIADRFPDGQLYADLRGDRDRPAEPATVLGGFLLALGHTERDLPPTAGERAALVRRSLTGRRTLLLLDNAVDLDQVRPLLPGTPDCTVLVTSRGRPVRSAFAAVPLDVFTHADALALFTRLVGAARVHAEPEATERIITACGHLPLAVRIVAARLTTRPRWTIGAVAARLADEHGRLGELATGEMTVAGTFLAGYRGLDAEQARAFRLLAGSAAPDLSVMVAATVLARPPGPTERLCESLVDHGLLRSLAPGRYGFHPLLRLFGRQVTDYLGGRGILGP